MGELLGPAVVGADVESLGLSDGESVVGEDVESLGLPDGESVVGEDVESLGLSDGESVVGEDVESLGLPDGASVLGEDVETLGLSDGASVVGEGVETLGLPEGESVRSVPSVGGMLATPEGLKLDKTLGDELGWVDGPDPSVGATLGKLVGLAELLMLRTFGNSRKFESTQSN